MLGRIERKLAEVQRWVDSVYALADVPAAVALAMYRTRPVSVPRLIWVRPARLEGFAVQIDAASMSDFAIYEEVFIDGIYDLSKVSFTPDAIIDCGAYHGYFTLLAAAQFHGVPVIAFEPNTANAEILRRNVRYNGLHIDVRPSAVSSRDGSATFSGKGCGGHLGGDGPGAMTVPVTDLCRLVGELACEALLLKLDIEGEESHLLTALMPVLPKRAAIFFEWHHGAASYETTVGLLARHGFNTVRTRANRADGSSVYIDAFAQR